MTIPTNGRDGAPIPSKPNNPPTSNSGVSGEPVGPYAPTRGTNGALLREWLAEQFGVLPTHIWTEDRVVKPLGARIDGLVDVVLRQEQRLQERFDAVLAAIHDVNAAVAPTDRAGEPLLTKAAANAYGQREYDRGVADGRASVGNRSPEDHEMYQNGIVAGRAIEDAEQATARLNAEARGFERGKAIGRSEAEAELLDQGWTPPGGVIIGMAESRDDLIEAGWIPPGSLLGHELEVITEPTDYEVWRDALTLAVTERNYIDADRNLNDTWLTARAERFWEQLQDVPVLKNDDGTDTEDIQTEPRMGTGND